MAFQINSVTVSGNLTSDPEVRHTPSGMAITRLSIAHNERRKNNQTDQFEDVAHFFDATVFGRIGEVFAQDLRKGDPVVVSGNLEQRRWQDKDGNNRSNVSIIARDVVRGQRGGGGGGTGGGGQGAGYQQGGGFDQGGQGGSYGGGGQQPPQPAAAPQGGWGQAPPQQGGRYQGGSDLPPADTSDFAPARAADPGDDDIPF